MNARIASLATVFVAALAALALPVASVRAAPTGQLPLRFVADVPLPGGSSRFDYQSLDSSRNRLYISHLAAGAAVIFDVKQQRVSATIAGLPGVHGVLVAPGIRRVFFTQNGGNKVTIDQLVVDKPLAREDVFGYSSRGALGKDNGVSWGGNDSPAHVGARLAGYDIQDGTLATLFLEGRDQNGQKADLPSFNAWLEQQRKRG